MRSDRWAGVAQWVGRVVAAVVLCVVLAACGEEGPGDEEPVRVFAAASLIDVMGEVGAAWEAEGHAPPVFNFAATSQLAQQIEQGARADVFISADEAWMDKVEQAGLIEADTRRVVAGNALVLTAPAGSELRLGSDGFAGLGAALGDGRLAMAEGAVPAGRYAREALEAVGAWDGVADRAVYAPDVRAALRLVEVGEAAAGVVYRTDAIAAGERVAMIGSFPAGSHTPISYPAAAVAGGNGGAFVEFLAGEAAQAAFSALGFGAD